MLISGLFNFTNIVFTIILLVMFGYGIKKKTSALPFATVGVIGTFIGIIYCLLSFDIKDINSSIQNLLDGMKTAFFVAALGLSLSLILTFINKFIFKIIEIDPSIDPSTKEILEALNNIIFAVQKQQNEISDVKNDFDIISEKMNKLIELQGNYKTTDVQANDENSYKVKEILDETVEKIGIIATSLNTIPTTVETINNLLVKIDSQIDKSEENIETFAKIKDSTGEVLPAIKSQLEKIIEVQIEKAEEQSEVIKNKLGILVDGIAEIIANQSVKFETSLNKELEENLTHFADTLAEISNKFADDYRPLASKLQEIIKMVENNEIER